MKKTIVLLAFIMATAMMPSKVFGQTVSIDETEIETGHHITIVFDTLNEAEPVTLIDEEDQTIKVGEFQATFGKGVFLDADKHFLYGDDFKVLILPYDTAYLKKYDAKGVQIKKYYTDGREIKNFYPMGPGDQMNIIPLVKSERKNIIHRFAKKEDGEKYWDFIKEWCGKAYYYANNFYNTRPVVKVKKPTPPSNVKNVEKTEAEKPDTEKKKKKKTGG